MSEGLLLWIIGGQSMLILGIGARLWSHERTCTARWVKLSTEHGALEANQQVVMRKLGL